jgi:hypothetical protein
VSSANERIAAAADYHEKLVVEQGEPSVDSP